VSASRWLYAAAAYNLAWGAGAMAFAGPLEWKVVGLLVLAYAPAYWWAAHDPVGHGHLVAVGLFGKVLGLLAFSAGAASGCVPLGLGFVVLANDLLWLPAFAGVVRLAAHESGGWRRFLAGDAAQFPSASI
jgi:hypothetical protein